MAPRAACELCSKPSRPVEKHSFMQELRLTIVGLLFYIPFSGGMATAHLGSDCTPQLALQITDGSKCSRSAACSLHR